jgi:site-specific recombinase XerC
LKIGDIDLDERSLQVVVKGGQWKGAIFSPQTAQYLREWMAFRKSDAMEIFVSTRDGKPFTREGMQTTIKRWGYSIGVKLSPHDLRRSFATLATIFGAPSRVVQVGGRWSNIEMVEHYTQGLGVDAMEPYFPVARLQKKATA